MYLKALEMQGFKSFPDKTVLEFGKGVTGVVGPNGSGKSNISDAVRWVLGEQSTKSLRGSKMEDVIFSGTKERRPQGFAEVTLRLDNSDGALNNPEPEVSVTRRYYRSGESAYIINSQTVRLKDVHELFMDTGLGRDGYSMVGQGKIEEMVSARSENRRDMFEEAAGISHYRYRRADAIKRLDQSEENLVRLRDIVAELKARVGPLEKQSQKAQQFLVYAAERKELEIGLWLNVLERSAEQIREQRGKLTVVQNQYDFAGHVLDKLSADIDAAAEGTREINGKIEEKRGENTRLEEQASALDQQAAVYETTVAHNNETAERICRDIAQQGENEAEIDAEIRENERQITELEKTVDELNGRLSALSEKLLGLKSRDEEYSDEYNAVSTVISALALKISQTDIMISSSASSSEEIHKRIASVNDAYAENKALSAELSEKREAQKKDFTEAAEKLEELNNVYAGFALRLRKAAEKEERLKEAYENKKLALLQKQSRLKFLEDTEKNMDGYQGSVKAVMREKARGTLRGIRGTVLQLISVKPEYTLAIETALGNSVQDIITETENDAKRAINMLKESNAGRATFLPLNAIKGRVLEEKGLDDQYGYINLAWELVKCDAEYKEIVRSLLGRIAVCEDLDCAIAMAKHFNYKFKIVTLDGQVINAGGSMTGGSKVSHSGFLARRSEMERLTAELAGDELSIAAASNDYKAATENYSREKADYDGIAADIMRQTEEKAAFERVLSVTDAQLHQTESVLEGLQAEKTQGEERIRYYSENVQIAEKEKEALLKEKEQKEKALSELTGGHDDLLSEREKINADMAQVNLSVVSSMKEQQAKRDGIESLIKRREVLAQRKAELDEEIEDIRKRNAGLADSIERTKAAALLLRQKEAENNEAVQKMIAERESFEKTIADSREQEKVKSEEREKLASELVRLEERRAALEKEQEDTERKLYEEYALTRREAAQIATPIESIPKAKQRLSELRGQIKALGNVNVAAIDEYKEVSSRYEFLSGQVDDIEKSKKELLKMIDELTTQMAERFRDRFEAINNGFKETFTQLFGGGAAELILEDENDILECGIDIKAQPPGKNVKSLSLLSGGEKGLTAIALLFAILKVRPAPFCIFDEVEAALDDVNVSRYAQYVRMMTDETQFILITHRRGTMEEADMLYGVTMQERGVSKLLELKTAEMVAELKLDE